MKYSCCKACVSSVFLLDLLYLQNSVVFDVPALKPEDCLYIIDLMIFLFELVRDISGIAE